MRPLTILFGLILGAGGIAGGLGSVNGGTEDFTVTVDRDPQAVYSAFSAADGYGSALRDAQLMKRDSDIKVTRQPGKSITWHVPSVADQSGSTVTLAFAPGEQGKTVISATVDVAPVHDTHNSKLVVSEEKVAAILEEAVSDIASNLGKSVPYGDSARILNGVFDLVAIATNPGMSESLNRAMLDAFAGIGDRPAAASYGEREYGTPDNYGEPTDDYGAPMVDPSDAASGY